MAGDDDARLAAAEAIAAL
jgi:hypothetical protein